MPTARSAGRTPAASTVGVSRPGSPPTGRRPRGGGVPTRVRTRASTWPPHRSASPTSAARLRTYVPDPHSTRTRRRGGAYSISSKAWTRTRRGARSTSIPARASSWRRRPPAVERRVHGRHLLDLTDEPRQHRAHVVGRQGRHRPFPGHGAGRVEGVGGDAEPDGGQVLLVLALEIPGELGPLAQEDRQEPRRHGIERASVADLRDAEHAAKVRDDLERGDPRPLVGQQETVRDHR